MIFIDSNIPMYLVGQHHPNQDDARRRLEEVVVDGRRLVTDAEVFQEILHRYRAIDRPEAVQDAFDVLNALVDDVFPITHEDVDAAREVLVARWSLSARDALHVAVMQRHHVDEILSYDRGFDAIPGLSRLGS